VYADSCTDYENLLTLAANNPQLQVEYAVQLGEEKFSGTAKQISLSNITQADIANLPYLPQLQSILYGGGGATADIALLKEYCQNQGVEFLVTLGEVIVPLDAKGVSTEAVTDEQLDMLAFLPELTELQITNPEASAEDLAEAQEDFPQVELTWEQELYGTVYSSDLKELDLSGIKINSLEELEQEMVYFPDVEKEKLPTLGGYSAEDFVTAIGGNPDAPGRIDGAIIVDPNPMRFDSPNTQSSTFTLSWEITFTG
jgi:hypothetical protein